jgi:uncharacterized protein involved in exopolysaccharide biosynthesis
MPATRRVSTLTPQMSLELKQLLLSYYKFIFLLAALSGGLSWAAAQFLLPKQYSSSATIMPKGKSATDLLSGKIGAIASSLGASVSNATQDVQQLQALLKSHRLSSAVRKLPAFQNQGPEILSKLKFGVSVTNLVFSLNATAPTPELAQDFLTGHIEELQKIMIDNQVRQSERTFEFINARIGEVKTVLDEIETKLMKMRVADRLDPAKGFDSSRPIDAQIARVKREYQAQAMVLETLYQQREVAAIESKREEQMFVIIDPPSKNIKPALPRPLNNLVYGALLGGLVALGITWLLSRWGNMQMLSSFESRLFIKE